MIMVHTNNYLYMDVQVHNLMLYQLFHHKVHIMLFNHLVPPFFYPRYFIQAIMDAFPKLAVSLR